MRDHAANQRKCGQIDPSAFTAWLAAQHGQLTPELRDQGERVRLTLLSLEDNPDALRSAAFMRASLDDVLKFERMWREAHQ